jgi:serine/threonine protein phosphatase PrpC
MSEPTPSETDNSQFELEELSESIELPASPEPLATGTALETPDGLLHIDGFLVCKGAVNLYEATFSDGRRASLRETQDGGSAELMRHEFEVLSALKCPMLSQAFACWDKDGRTYLATEPVTGSTLGDALNSRELTPLQVVSVLAQVAYAVCQLHSQGWLHLALRPTTIVLGKPVRVLDLGHSTRIGQRPPTPFYFAGYSAPELLADGAIDARADIYSIGALLFHAMSGYPIAESGAILTGWQPETPIAGVPQILHKCLGPLDTRYATMVELHQDLVRLARRCAPRIRYECVSATSIGLEPTRTVNQDAYCFACVQSEAEDGARSWAVSTVADGMGGMAAGEVASAVAVNTVLTEAMAALAASPNLSADEQAKLTADWVRKANEKVCDAMEAKQAKGGCTLVCALLLERRLTIAHVGDCRIYLIRDGSIQTLTRDHSVAMSLVMQGELDISQLRGYPDRSNVTRSLGERKRLPGHYVDTLTQVAGKESMELRAGDTLLLCSDGLWEPVVEQTIVDVLAEKVTDLKTAADKLIALALQNGAPDNATVSLLRIDEIPQTQSKV